MPRPRSTRPGVPPLVAGDHLTRAEFERRYGASPHIKKAELIEGVVFMLPPVSDEEHGVPHGSLSTWLGTYAVRKRGVKFSVDSTVRLDLSNEPQPDCSLCWLPDHGGKSRLGEQGYIEGPPDLAVEIAASSAAYDMHEKKRAYERNGVREYLVWLTREDRVIWFANREGVFEPLQPDADGVLKSEVFPGLWLNVLALLDQNYEQVLSTLDEGLRSSK